MSGAKPRILIIYATTDGHTRKIAYAVAQSLGGAGCMVDIFDARQSAHGEPFPAEYDGVIVAASMHLGRYQKEIRHWVERHAPALNRKPSAFISVCLGILEKRPEVQNEVQRILRLFQADNGWRPVQSRNFAGAVPYTRYGWLKKWIMKRKVAAAGGDTDTTRDFEYTDWAELARFTNEFAGRLKLAELISEA